MEQRKHTIYLLTFLLVAGLLGLSASVLGANWAAAQEALRTEAGAAAGWEQANSNGFGDPLATEVSALETFNGYLYAGTHSTANDALILRSADGTGWSPVIDPGFGSSHDTAPRAILDLALFKGYLYASTGRGNAVQIWRSSDGVNWGRVVNAGFGDPDIVDITVMTEYGGWLYVGATKQDNEAQIWRTYSGDGDLSNWTQVAAGTEPAQVTGLAEFSVDGELYAAVESEGGAPAQLWRSFGGVSWTAVITDGFGSSNTILTGGVAEFGGYLYVGAGDTGNGALLWRSNDGDNWEQSITPGFGDPNNQKVESVYVFQNQLYVSTRNSLTGMEVWRSPDGATWEQVNTDGFGDGDNSGSNWANATADFLNQLYLGSQNDADGGELWRSVSPYGLALSADQAKSGLAGQELIYTLQITNTGTLTDTYNLALSGQVWTTTLSAAQIGLGPQASGFFTVTVTIPLDAADQENDTVTVSATSQGDGDQTDASSLTSTSIVPPTYGVALSAGRSGSGPAGQDVIYTLAITNTGTVADTFDLSKSGQAWLTTLSTASVYLEAKASTQFSATVTIPAGAAGNDSDTVTIKAISQGDVTKQAEASLTTNVTPIHGVALPADQARSGQAGTSVTYTVPVTNTGNVTDSYALEASGNGWPTWLAAGPFELAAQDSTTFTVTVTVPADAPGNTSDSVVITATSSADPGATDAVVLTTTVLPSYNPSLSGDAALSGTAGATVTYTLQITNAGNIADTYEISATGNTWTTTLSTVSVELARGVSTVIYVYVQIPATAPFAAHDEVTIVASSQSDPGQSDSTRLTTTNLDQPPERIYLPLLKNAP